MFYSVDDKIVKVGDAFPERKVKSLTFQTKDSQFPLTNAGGSGQVRFGSVLPQNVVVNYGDGTIETHPMILDGGVYRFGLVDYPADPTNIPNYAIQPHVFNDIQNNGNLRSITFEFENLLSLFEQVNTNVNLYGFFPRELGEVANLQVLLVNNSKFLEGFPDNIINLKNLSTVSLQGIYANNYKKPFIEAGFLNSSITALSISGTYDLSDPISSNFFQINNLRETLESLGIIGCDATFYPESLKDCYKLKSIRGLGNPLINMENAFNVPNSLTELWISGYPFQNTVFDGSDLNLLRVLYYPTMSDNQIIDIDNKWDGLKSLKILSNFAAFVSNDNSKFDLFIDSFYSLCTRNGFLNPASQTAINTGFPDQFRDILWGASGLTQTGAIQAPAGFVLGSANGTPANQGEKIYVLVNNYGHNVTTSGNFN